MNTINYNFTIPVPFGMFKEGFGYFLKDVNPNDIFYNRYQNRSFVNVQQFKNQLFYMKDRFKFISPFDIKSAIADKSDSHYAVMTFDDEADAIRKANDTEFGLSGSIWTNNSGKAIRVARAVESGNLSVNSNSSVRYWTPFGGYKQSGLGRELGPDALDSFTEVKNVFIATDN